MLLRPLLTQAATVAAAATGVLPGFRLPLCSTCSLPCSKWWPRNAPRAAWGLWHTGPSPVCGPDGPMQAAPRFYGHPQATMPPRQTSP